MDVQSLSPEVIQDTEVAEAIPVAAEEIDKAFGSNSIDLLSKPLGTRILGFSDEWFAAAENLINPAAPITKPGVYVYTGAWYDGWETRRHNPQPFDWVVFRLGVRSGRVAGVEIDTAFFNGNHAPEIAVEGCFISGDEDKDKEVMSPHFNGWTSILGRQECGPSRRQAWQLREPTKAAFTHIRLLMFPDGGIARFRLYGHVAPVFPASPDTVFDLAAATNGGVATVCSDQHFGKKDNLLLPGRGEDMGDGWETKRSRGVHIDWVAIQLGTPGEIDNLLVDTAHFRGNFPKKVQVFAAASNESGAQPDPDDHEKWTEILSPQPCGPDKEHVYDGKLLSSVQGKTYAHVKMVIIPDGGVKRIRVFGRRRP